MRNKSLVGHAVALGLAGSDTDEGAVEMLALSRRDRVLVAETMHRLSYLQEGDDVTRACEIVIEALRRGDEGDYWRDAAATDGCRQERSVTGNGTSAGSAAPSAWTRVDVSPADMPDEPDVLQSVAAHRLLNDSAVVSMGISTLLSLWDRLTAEARTHLLTQMASHATAVDDGLKLLTLGLDSDDSVAPPRTRTSEARLRKPMSSKFVTSG